MSLESRPLLLGLLCGARASLTPALPRAQLHSQSRSADPAPRREAGQRKSSSLSAAFPFHLSRPSPAVQVLVSKGMECKLGDFGSANVEIDETMTMM